VVISYLCLEEITYLNKKNEGKKEEIDEDENNSDKPKNTAKGNK
jgi:hypothetical protein